MSVIDLLPMDRPFFRRTDGEVPEVPMKYVDADPESWLDYLSNPAWVAQQKMDGTRAFIHVTSKGVDWRGLKHSAAVQHFAAIEEALKVLAPEDDDLLVLDGEILIRTGEYHLFDLAYARVGGEVLVSALDSQIWRREVLERVFDLLAVGPVHLVREAAESADKHALMAAAREAGVEGLVFKHIDKPYQPGKRTKDVLKAKFVTTADVVVLAENRGRNEAGRETGNIEFGIFTADGSLVPLGACSCIGKPSVQYGMVIEVAYLYRDDSGGLVQPRMMRVREDKAAIECTDEQFRPYSRRAV